MTVARVSGVGAVCGAGVGAEALWRGMDNAEARVTEVEDLGVHGMLVRMYQAADIPANTSYHGGRASRLAVLAALEAVREAGSAGPGVTADRIGVVVGTGMGDAAIHELDRQWPRQTPMYGPASAVARAVGARGPVMSLSNACAASAYALDAGAAMLADGECDRVVVVGAEVYSRIAFYCFERMHALDPRSCRPFAVDRMGTLFGEGAGALVLDAVPTATDDSGPGVFVKGVATSCDGGHPTAPDQTGEHARRAMFDALKEAGTAPGEIGAMLPHGTGTLLNDQVEAGLLEEMNQLAGRPVPAYALKGLVGHTGGAAGALAAVAAVLMIRHRMVPGNVEVGELMPGVLESISTEERELFGDIVVNAYAFGGANASVVIGGNR